MAEYTEAFDTPSASTSFLAANRGGFARGGFRGVGMGGGFVRAGGEPEDSELSNDQVDM